MAALCALLPGGKSRVAARHTSIRARLEHLYDLRGISRRLKETDLDDSLLSAIKAEEGTDSGARLVKTEEIDGEDYTELAGNSQLRKTKHPITNINGTSPPSSPSNGFQRNWDKAILHAPFRNGKINQLSLKESLALQAQESERLLAARLIAERREENERIRTAQSGQRSKETREMLQVPAKLAISTCRYRYSTIPDWEPLEDDHEDLDWHQQDFDEDDEHGASLAIALNFLLAESQSTAASQSCGTLARLIGQPYKDADYPHALCLSCVRAALHFPAAVFSMEDESLDIGFSTSDTHAWDNAPPKQDDLANAVEKERIIKDIMSTQEGLRALLGRVEDVTDDIKKLTDENAMLQTYLDNMTRNTAMFAGGRDGKR
ncbi:MAG: hypothetical protein CYPHOPRED_001348 [Cyphobasidiales sp. Tagirdzhanova-0007]|nr:MAG: hypothetical protein CYPHOPRED_001348 [Cyphobasidiales sp. Tagirdzhanova-0007]